MRYGNWIPMLVIAVAVAAIVSLIIAPKVNNASPTNPPLAQQTTPTRMPTPAPPQRSFANAAVISRESDGHYWTRAEVDDTAVKFMVDTGASTVALTYRDAQRIGLDPESLDFKWEIRTAGGITHGASVLLKEIRIGRVKVENVEAMILKDVLDQSLLGMTFLGELESYEFRKKQLIIRQ